MHRLRYVGCYDQVAIMDDGLLVKLGIHAEVFAGETDLESV